MAVLHMLLGENPGVLDVISYFYVFSDENSDDADGNMGSPIFSSTHVASNFVLGKLKKYFKCAL